MLRFATILTAIACLTFVSKAQEVPTWVAVINVQKAITGTNDGKKALQDLNARVAPKQKDFDARQRELAQLQDQLTKGANLMSDEKKTQLTQDLEDRKKKLERDVQDAQEDVQNHQRGVMDALSRKLTAVVTKYAKDNKYALVFETGSADSQVIYSADAIDITPAVIALYDQTYKSPNQPKSP